MVGPNPDNLRFEQGNPLTQLILRIGIEQFLRQQAGGIAFRTGQVIVHLVHLNRTPRACCQRGKRVGAVAVAAGQQGTGKWLNRFQK